MSFPVYRCGQIKVQQFLFPLKETTIATDLQLDRFWHFLVVHDDILDPRAFNGLSDCFIVCKSPLDKYVAEINLAEELEIAVHSNPL